jgi:alanine racemase
MKNDNLTWVELDKKALKKNLKSIYRLAGKRLIAAAVKANAYGHGLKEIVSLLNNEKIDYLAVHTIDEAADARRYGWQKNILCVGYIPLCDLDFAFDFDLEPTVYNIETVKTLGKITKDRERKISIHLKIETGTNRQGVEKSKVKKFIGEIKKYPGLTLKGVSTHFANIEDTTDHTYANYQLKLFKDIVADIRKLGARPKLLHTACSAALLLFENTKLDLVRPGIALYGLWPSKETYLSYRLEGGSNYILSPVLSWKTRVAQIKDVPRNSYIGYGCTYRTTSRTKLAVLPVGYYDGYDRGLSNLSYVLIKGKRAPVRGRVCMNLMMVDITDIRGVKLEDEVTLLGKDSTEVITADQMASWANTVNYEIISRINTNIARIIK